MRRIRAGGALALLVAIACMSAESRAGCHRNGVGPASASRVVLENLRSIGALAATAEPAGTDAAPVPLGGPRRGCNGPSCSSNPEPAAAPASAVPFRLKAEWAADLAPVPPSSPTPSAAAIEGCSPWANPAVVGVFHPPRRPEFLG